LALRRSQDLLVGADGATRTAAIVVVVVSRDRVCLSHAVGTRIKKIASAPRPSLILIELPLLDGSSTS
jgi:hypothetical protein